MLRYAMYVFLLIIFAAHLFIEYSPSGRLCREKGGSPSLDGCYQFKSEKIEIH
jgi:hypothetical protein